MLSEKMKYIFKTLSQGLLWLFLLTLLTIAIHLKSPYLLAYRTYETPFLLFITLTLIPVYYFKTRRIYRILSLTTLILILGFTLWGETSFQYHRHTVINLDTTVASHLGQHFIIGYEDIDNLKPLIRQGLIAGIFITRRNTQGHDFESLQQEIATLQQLRANAGLPPLIITTDQEGGIVSHLSPIIERMPPLSSIIDQSNTHEDLIANAIAYGEKQGQSLAALGITLNLSPVVDLKTELPSNQLDFHSLISQRAISTNPTTITTVSQAYIQGLQNHGVQATLKHFPGLGRVQSDTHHFSASIDTPIEELQRTEWLPFKTTLPQTNALLMIGHVILSQLDPQNPASFSKPVIQNIIRNQWQHQGILITDDLTMRAAYSHGFCYAAINALNAGVDLLLVSYDHEKYYNMMYCVAQAYERGQLDHNMLESSNQRISQLIPQS